MRAIESRTKDLLSLAAIKAPVGSLPLHRSAIRPTAAACPGHWAQHWLAKADVA